MREVTRFQTADGRLFTDRDIAAAHEEQLQTVTRHLVTHTGTRRPDPNGDNYVQHQDGTRSALDAIYSARGVHPRVDDNTGSPWYGFWWRLACIDAQNREWGQPYFANNPNLNARKLESTHA